MARFDIISKDGKNIRFSGKPRYSGSYLKPSFLEFSEIASPTPIAWEVGDYVDYPRTGMRYRLYSIPQPSKNARKGSYGGAFTYSNVQFHAATKELEIALFRDLVANDNNIHFSTSPDVATYENVEGIARRIQTCMDHFYPGRWEIRMAEFDAVADAEVIEKIATAKDFAMSGGTCLDALSKIYELWEEIGWVHTHENGKEVITIGYANKRIGANTTDAYLYGKGNGLTAIKKSQTNKDEFATRLYVYGSERNLPHRYYNGKDILNAESVDIRNLMLPLDKWGTTDGLPDARKAYLENAEAVAKYGVIPKTHYFDSDDAGADIYPSIEDMTVGQLRKVLADMGETKYSPDASIYPDDSERVDEVWGAPRVMDDGVLKRNGKEHDIDNGWYLFATTTPGTTIPKGTAEKIAVVENHLIKDLDIDSQGIIRAKITFTSDKICTLADAGYESVSGVLTLANSLDSPSIKEEVGFTFVLNDDGVWEGRLPKVIANYDNASYVRYVAFATMSVFVTPKNALASDVTASVNISDGYVTFIADQLFDKTFQLTLKQIGFDINERATMGEGKVISMKTGMCAGRNFVISECRYVANTDKWVLVCKRQQDDTLGMLFPNKDYQIAADDQFVLLDIALPEAYIRVNQERLLTEGEKLLAKASKIQNHYEPMIDAKVMIESGRTLREGMFMEISDEDVIDNGTDYILIDSLSIYEDESAIPTYKVTLREKKKVTYKGTPSATSETSTKSYGEEQTANVDIDLSDYATKSYVNSAISNITPGGGGTADITIDTAMSDTSENAVANKVIKKYVDDESREAYDNAYNDAVAASTAYTNSAKQQLIASKAGAFYLDPSTNMFTVFTTVQARDEYLAGGTAQENILYQQVIQGGGGGTSETTYRMTVHMDKASYSFTTASETMPIACTFSSEVQYKGKDSYEAFPESALFSVVVYKPNGTVVTAANGVPVSEGGTFNFDLKPYLGNGDNTVIVKATGLISSETGQDFAPVSVTTMSLAPFGFAWYDAWKQGQDYLIRLKVQGALNKTLHVQINGNEITESLGTFSSDSTPKDFMLKSSYHPAATGVYNMKIWMTADSSGVPSDVLTYNIMCVKSTDVNTAKLVCINEVATFADNYAESKLFSYATYNGGGASSTPTLSITKGSTTIVSNTASATTGVPYDFTYAFSLDMSESSASIVAKAVFGNTQSATITLRNETAFAPVGGYSFYMDAATRSNLDAYKTYLQNEANNQRVSASWTDMAWVDGMDGWTTDDEGNKCLLIPAMSKANVNFAPMQNISTVTIEMFYKAKNVSDFDEEIITIATATTSSWMGVKIKPTNICLHSRLLFSDDLKQSYDVQDEKPVHLVIAVNSNYLEHGNVAIIYVNGVKKCTFEWGTNDSFAHNGNLMLGSSTADLYLYKIRVYGFQFDWPQVMQNYISCMTTAADKSKTKRREDSVLDDNNQVDYDKVYGKYNTFVVELPKGAVLPNRKDNSSNIPVEGSNLYINIVQDPSCSIQGEFLNVPLEGQGTTAMTYYRWNLRSKTSSAYDKFRITAKKNVASSMHSHKMGATRLYNDLNLALVGANDANGRVAVYQYPVYGFQKIEYEDTPGTYYYDFIGLYTIGPDKGDASTFGYDNATYENTLIHMEGTDHSPRGVGMDYPWELMTVGLNKAGDTCLGSATFGGVFSAAWEIGACCNKEDDDFTGIKDDLDREFAPAYKIDYECTPMIVGLPLGDTIDDANADILNFRAQNADNGFAYSDCIIYDNEYYTYYYDEVLKTYVKDGRMVYSGLTSAHGYSKSTLDSKSSVLAKTLYIRECRKARYRAEMEQYWHLNDSIFHACFLDLIGATDNEKKNSYPYKFKPLASQGKWRWRQDDLDTIFDVNNQGFADKKYSILNTDKLGSTMIFKGNTSYHWRCIREYYKDEMKAMMQRIFAKMVELCPSGYGSSNIQKLVGCIRHYFWDYAQEYFTGGAYNLDARWTYEDAWRIGAPNAVPVLQQSLGSHYEAEVAWVTMRMLFLASMYEFGAFSDYQDSSEGQIKFRQGKDFTFTLTPAVDMRPAIASGQSVVIYASGRVLAGNSVSIETSSETGADTDVYIQGADWMQDVGDFSTVTVGSQAQPFEVASKRLQKLKVGDATASKVTTNIARMAIHECPSLIEIDARNITALANTVDLTKCPRLRRAYFGGTSLTSITLPEGSKIQAYGLPSTIQSLELRKLPLLTTSGLIYDNLNALTYVWVEDNKNLDGYDLLKNALEDGSPLNNIRVVGFTKTATADDTAFLLALASGDYHGITPTGTADNTIPPVLVGTVNYDTIDGDVYDALKAAYGNNLTINYNKLIAFIKFADAEVLRVLLAKGVDKDGDGGITREEAEAVTTIGAWFKGNTTIVSFDEFQYFTGITLLNNYLFQGCTSLKSIIIPSSVTQINTETFYNCTSLTDCVIPMSVVSLQNNVFRNCPMTNDINLPNLTSLGTRVFQNTAIRKVVSLGKITSIPDGDNSSGAFYGCKDLSDVNLHEGLTYIGRSAFAECTSLALIDIPSSVAAIGNKAFYNCSSLAIVLNAPNLESIDSYAFSKSGIVGIESLGKVTTLPESGSSSDSLFSKCQNLGYVKLPNTLTHTGRYTFEGCTALTEIVIPNSVVTVGYATFIRCAGLVKVDIGEGVQELGEYILQGADSLTAIICRAATPPSITGYTFYRIPSAAMIYVPDDSVDAYKAASGWSNASVVNRIKPLSEYNG